MTLKMENIHIALKGFTQNVTNALTHGGPLNDMCRLYATDATDTAETFDATVMMPESTTVADTGWVWLNDDIRIVTEENENLTTALQRNFRLSTVRTTHYHSDMSSAEMELYDAIICPTDEERDAALTLFPMQSIVAMKLYAEEVCVIPIKGSDWHVEGDDAPDATLDSAHKAIYTAIDVVRARREWDEAHANPLPKLFVEKKK